MARPNTIFRLDVSELQRCASRITSVLDIISQTLLICDGLPPAQDTERLLKTLIIVETCSLLECLYPSNPPNPDSAPDLLTIVSGSSDMDVTDLAVGEKLRDTVTAQKLRTVRNHIGAHVDSSKHSDMAGLLTEMDQVTMADMSEVLACAEDAFYKCCQKNIHLRGYLLHRVSFPVQAVKLEVRHTSGH